MKHGKRVSKPESAPRKLPHIGAMDIILIVVGIALLAFTVKMIGVFEEKGAVPDTLITGVYALLGGECGVMGWIKTTKERNKERRWEQEDKREARQEPPDDNQGGV